MITIKSTQKKIKTNLEQLKKDAQTLLNLLNYHDFDLNIYLTTNKTIKAYNKKYRNKDTATDILSFPYWPDLKPGQKIVPVLESDKHLGDIIISLEYIHNQLQDLHTDIDNRMRVLLVHGFCHLLGYDHITDKDYKVMHAQEISLLEQLNKKN